MTTIEFPHSPPKGMYYEYENLKRNVIAIWICYDRKFDYNLGHPVRCIWGFYDSKKRIYLAPVNSKTIGKCVKIEDTSSYSAMQVKSSPLEKFFC